MKLKPIYDSAEEIPEGFTDLFVEKDGKFHFDGVEGGVKTDLDIKKLQDAARKERDEHKATKQRLAAYGELTPEKLSEILDENETLKAQLEAGGKVDETKLEGLIEARAKSKLTPVVRDLEKERAEKAAIQAERDALAKEKRSRRIQDAVREAVIGEKGVKVRPTALADIELLAERVLDIDEDGNVVTRDQVGFAPGLTPRDWLSEVQAAGTRSHWFPENESAGAAGGKGGPVGGANPFAAEKPNITVIAKLIESDPKKARVLAQQAKKLGLYEQLGGPKAA